MKRLTASDLEIATLGPCRFQSPLCAKGRTFAEDPIRIEMSRHVRQENRDDYEATFEEAGPRREIFFDPAETTAAFVTCGGLSPGLNNVIRSG